MKMIINKKDLSIISFRHDDIAEKALKETIESHNKSVNFWNEEAMKNPEDHEANEMFKKTIDNNYVLMTQDEYNNTKILKNQLIGINKQMQE